MADFVDRVKLIFEATTTGASKGVGELKQSVSEAEGGFGKLKAGASSALGLIGANAALSAGAAAVAIGKFTMDAVNRFEDLALKANDFAQAAGLSVDEASRWMEVAGDVGVNVETLEGAINKMNLAAGKGDLAKLGIDGETTNEQLLASLTHLQNIPDASQRATEGVKIFGKSWTNLAPLVESSKDLKQALADVSSGQAISDAEVQKAKDYRDAMDKLSDTWSNFVLHVGEGAIGPITDVLQLIGELGDSLGSLAGAAGGSGGIDWGEVFGAGKIGDITGGLKQAADGSLSLVDNMKGIGKATIGLIPGLSGWADENLTVESSQDKAAQATADATLKAQEQAAQAKETEDAIRNLTNAVLASFNSQLAYEDAQGKTTTAIGKYVAAAVDAGNAAGTSTDLNDKYKQSMNDAEQAALNQAAADVKRAEDAAKAEGATLTAGQQNDILRASLLDVASTLGPDDPLRAHLMEYIGQLGQIPADKNTDVTANTSQAENALKNLHSMFDAITHAFGKPLSVSGAPSMVAPGTPAPAMAPAAMARAGASSGPVVNVTYNAPPGLNPADVVRVLNRWTSTRGSVLTTGATGL